MKTIAAVVVCGLLALSPSSATGAIRPSFELENCAWNATHIVLATEGDKIDGVLTVLESWKGDLKKGDIVTVPELAAFAEESSREVAEPFGRKDPDAAANVSCSRMVLFLKKTPLQPAWAPAASWGGFNVSVVWIEKGNVYGFAQSMNPGPSELIRLRTTEADIRAVVAGILRKEASFAEAKAVRDPAKRAEALAPLTRTGPSPSINEAFAALAECGEGALPVLRRMLRDQSFNGDWDDVTQTMAKAGGKAVAPELVETLKEEAAFWKKTGPGLNVGWWSGTGLDEEQLGLLHHRYGKVYAALKTLGDLRFEDCRKPVTEFRDFWRSLPQLEDKSGLDQISEACDDVLRELDKK